MKSPKLKLVKQRKVRDGDNAMPFDPASYLETVAQGRSITAHKSKTVLFKQGDEAESIIYIRSGKVKVTILSAEGSEMC